MGSSILKVPTGPEIRQNHGLECRSYSSCVSLSLFVSFSLKLSLRLRPPFRSFLLLPSLFLPSFFRRSSCFNFFPVGGGRGYYLRQGCIAHNAREIHSLGLGISVSSWSKLTRRVQNLEAQSRDTYPPFLSQYSMRRKGDK